MSPKTILLVRSRTAIESARKEASHAFSTGPGQAVTPAEKRRAELKAREAS
jgi:hypothetical protein